ncbi:hypothetical protein AB0758_44990 [Tolypothrix bouteillei VB521301_2]|uniref:hypothetical protein n=1 Tax=Tolypothrix bouteillei TaxID=1246981 RepID=UPI0038B59B33
MGKENSVRQKFENFLGSNQSFRAVVNSNSDLTIKSDEWTPGGEIKVKRSYNSLKEATRNSSTVQSQPTIQELIVIGNQTTVQLENPQIPETTLLYLENQVPMVYSHYICNGEPQEVPVNRTMMPCAVTVEYTTTRGV